MESGNQNKIEQGTLSSFERIEKVPPLKMILYCSMAGMGMLFLILGVMFLKTLGSGAENTLFALPKLFSVSTVFILLSGFYMSRVPQLYQQDNLKKLDQQLLVALLMSGAFSLCQVFAWNNLLKVTQVSFQDSSAGVLLFIVSALHLLHLAGGIAFTCFIYLKNNRAAADPIRTLIFIRDPFRTMQLEMLRTYWHFLGAVWVALYFVFLFAL